MNENYKSIHEEMLESITDAAKVDMAEGAQIVACFWVAHTYWDKVKQIVHPRDFNNEKEEIEFFKKVKPLFTAQMEYFLIRSEASVCIPKEPIEQLNYWDEEKKRYMRFFESNAKFIDYYESDKCYMDSVYFLRKNFKPIAMIKSPIFDKDPDYCTSHDHLARKYLAQKMYWEFCKQRIEALISSSVKNKTACP